MTLPWKSQKWHQSSTTKKKQQHEVRKRQAIQLWYIIILRYFSVPAVKKNRKNETRLNLKCSQSDFAAKFLHSLNKTKGYFWNIANISYKLNGKWPIFQIISAVVFILFHLKKISMSRTYVALILTISQQRKFEKNVS